MLDYTNLGFTKQCRLVLVKLAVKVTSHDCVTRRVGMDVRSTKMLHFLTAHNERSFDHRVSNF